MTLERDMSYAPNAGSPAYSGVLSRRVLAFLVDYLIIAILWVPAAVLLFFVGIATLGLALSRLCGLQRLLRLVCC